MPGGAKPIGGAALALAVEGLTRYMSGSTFNETGAAYKKNRESPGPE